MMDLVCRQTNAACGPKAHSATAPANAVVHAQERYVFVGDGVNETLAEERRNEVILVHERSCELNHIQSHD